MIHFTLVVIIVNAAPVEQPPQPAPVEQPRMVREPGMIYMDCERCGWEGAYESMSSAKQGIASHRRWCRDGHGRKKTLFGGG